MAKKQAAKKAPSTRKRGRPPLTEAERAERKANRVALAKARKVAAAEATKHAEAAVRKANRARGKAQKISRTVKEGAKRGRGAPPFEPTVRDRRQVELLVGMGLRQEDICVLITNPRSGRPIDTKTLKLYFPDELERGIPRVNSLVARSLFRKATGSGPGATTAAIYWTKARMGWRETIHVEADLKHGVLVPPPEQSPDEWIRASMERARETEMPEGVSEE